MFYLSNEFRLKRYFHMILIVSQLFTNEINILTLPNSVGVSWFIQTRPLDSQSWQLFPFNLTEWTQFKIVNYNYSIYCYMYTLVIRRSSPFFLSSLKTISGS